MFFTILTNVHHDDFMTAVLASHLFTMLEKLLPYSLLNVFLSFCKQSKREKIKEVHLNEFGYCSCCAENSPWAEISTETLVNLK